MIFNGDYYNANVLIKDKNFVLKNMIPNILPYVKSVSIFLSEDPAIRLWQENCFNEYGVKPRIYHSAIENYTNFDVIADFEKIKNNTLEIISYNNTQKIYPNFKYLEIPDKLKVLEDMGISRCMICAAFKE